MADYRAAARNGKDDLQKAIVCFAYRLSKKIVKGGMELYQKKDYIFSAFGVAIVSIFPILFLWLNNIIQVQDVGSVGKLIGTVILVAAVLFTAFFCIYKFCLFSASLAVMVTAVFFENQLYFEKLLRFIFPDARYWHGISITIFLLILIFLFLKKLGEENGRKIVTILSLVFTLLTVFNLVMAIPAMITKIQANRADPKDSDNVIVSDSQQGRNVYWLLFDDYAPNVSMMEYYGYDNSPFTDWLEERGFTVSYTSRNESKYTPVITCNIANLKYVAGYSDERTLNEDFALVLEQRKNSEVLRAFQTHGYDVVGIGLADFYGYTGEIVGQTKASATVDGKDFAALIFEKTALYPFFASEVNSSAEEMLSQLAYLQNPVNLPESNTFVLAHFNCPHAPYLFFGDGTPATAQNPSDYLEYFKFATTQMRAMVETIQENDPTAVIALMSDHGAKGLGEWEQKVRCFAALYNGGGEPLAIEGYSGINVMVTILNEALGTDYAYVPYEIQEEMTRF